MRRIRQILIGGVGALALTSAALGQSGVDIEVAEFGVGGHFRPGGITAIRLKLTSNLNEPTPVWVQWEVPNADGDITENGRSLTLTPSQTAFAWLYAELPPGADPTTVYTVRVFEERDGERRGELGGVRISGEAANAQLVDLGASMIAVIGDKQMGLNDYSNRDFSRTARPVSAHEDTRIVFGMRPAELPDRWWGLMHFEAIAWGGENTPPQDLGIDQARALREYVRRGGHLIISLPGAGNPWGLGATGQTQLEYLLPCRTEGQVPRKDEANLLTQLLPALSKYSDLRSLIARGREPEFDVRVFKDLRGTFNVIDNYYEPLTVLPDGRVIVIQRVYGHGRVTVIGVDLAEQRLASLGLPQADAFWNRILGRRADTPTSAELFEIEKKNKLEKNYTNRENALGSGPLISGRINMEKRAGQGLLLALVLFIAYWLAAGPAGFAILKHYGHVKHAWVAFAGCAALFTAIAWGSVGLIPKPMEIKHLTFLDHIARPLNDPRPSEPQYQRAISYFSLYLPTYGSTPVAIASDEDQRDLLVSWTPPGEVSQPFPNADRYRIDMGRSPAAYSLPARSTSTQLRAHWLGGLDPDWGGMLRVDPSNPVRADMVGGVEVLRGAIINELPGTLRDIKMIWVTNNRLTRRTYEKDDKQVEQKWVPNTRSGDWLNTGGMWAPSPLETGKPLDLGHETSKPAPIRKNMTMKYIDPYADVNAGMPVGSGTAVGDSNRRDYIEMLSMFGQLDPPVYLDQNTNLTPDSVTFHRELGRDLDLSAWFTRPCVIIIGYLENSACPVPIRVDGADEPPPSADGSLTVVRWIYPLLVNEKVAFDEVFVQE